MLPTNFGNVPAVTDAVTTSNSAVATLPAIRIPRMKCLQHPSETIKYLCTSLECNHNFLCSQCECKHYLLRRPLDQFDNKTIHNELWNLLKNYEFKFAHFKQLIAFFEESVQLTHEKEMSEWIKLTEKFDCFNKVIFNMFTNCANNLKLDYLAKQSKFANILKDLRTNTGLINANCSNIHNLTAGRNTNSLHIDFELLYRYKETLRKFEMFSNVNQTLETNVKMLLNDKNEINANLENYFEPLAAELAKLNLLEKVGAVEKSLEPVTTASVPSVNSNDDSSVPVPRPATRPATNCSFANMTTTDGSSLRMSKLVNQMTIRVKLGNEGSFCGQFKSPHGFCLSPKEKIVIADTFNHRIQIFDKNGIFLMQFGSIGREDGFFWYPRKIAMFTNNEDMVISDCDHDLARVQIFTKNGVFLRKILLTDIKFVAGLTVLPSNKQIAVTDSAKPAIFIYAKSGALLNSFDCSEFMVEPSDLAFHDNKFYVCDLKAHDVAVVDMKGKLVRKFGSARVTNYPTGIDFTSHGEILVGDSHGNKFHVSVFNSSFELISEFECRDINVTRSCGLKISTEGHIITLARNNHFLLILNTYYLPNDE